MNCKHIHFVPNKLVKNPSEDNGIIFVFSARNNKKIYKRKRFEIGALFYNPKVKEWCYYPVQDKSSLSYDTMMIIVEMLIKLNGGLLKYKPEEGEFEA